LAEIGVDVLNPIQESAASMDQMAVKNAYGDRLALMCGPDTQSFLPNASASEVRQATARLLDALGSGGGYIFAVSHHIQHDTPDANIRAMLDALGGDAAGCI
ncbi:MAG: uroporphyrinogen decarboxylase family protein, partial [Clostridiales bacterium]|jgi:uroporphyrinogen decarboxylase|nr:uroporphyrinogen decarboxylase family protein [Clostridiales bacterium]